MLVTGWATTMKDSHRDTVFASLNSVGDFVFDESVVAVFPDMINRSVPGYATIISMIGVLSERYCTKGSTLFDLGCSLGAATFSMQQHISHDQYEIVAVDSSEAMITRLRETIATGDSKNGDKLNLVCADINDIEICNASVVVLNFTLQFIPRRQRYGLIKKIYEGMNPGGILILSEKIKFPDPHLDTLLIDLYHRFKECQGYSRLEISQKRSALENVLIPESIQEHKERLHKAGFTASDVWFQCFNFASLVAFK